MRVSKKGLAEIASHEGIVQMPYKDSVGVWTFGVGHTRFAGAPDPAKMAKGVARPLKEVMDLFARDIKKYEAGVDRRIRSFKPKQHEYDAAVSFHYNTGGIGRASWVSAWLTGAMADAYRRMMSWNKPSEIIPRRRKEAKLLRYGTYGDGWASVYPAYLSGRVNWGKGRRVNVLDILEDSPGTPEHPAGGDRPKSLSHYQQSLIDLGYNPGPVDGKWGKKTSKAVRAFQKDEGTLVADGILGPLTSAAIDQKMGDRPPQVVAASLLPAVPVAVGAVAAGFSLPQVVVFIVAAILAYSIWHFRYDIREWLLTKMGF